MTVQADDHVEDRTGVLQQKEHMAGMDRMELTVLGFSRPFPSVTRVMARLPVEDVTPWATPNIAIRFELPNPVSFRPISRVYTVRRCLPEQRAIEVDFVMHPDMSPAMRWLSTLAIGDTISVVGPRQHVLPNYSRHRLVALFADETAIPALLSILDNWPRGQSGIAYVETGDREAYDELPTPDGLTLHWLQRQPHTPPGTTGRLVDAAINLPNPLGWTLWAAGERQEMRAIRKHYLDVRGYSKDDLRLFGYWRQGISSSDIDRARLDLVNKLQAEGQNGMAFEDFDITL